MRAIREAVALDDPDRIVAAIVDASCDHWEQQGHILLTLKAVTELEPGAIALIDEQREDQRTAMQTIARTLRRAASSSSRCRRSSARCATRISRARPALIASSTGLMP